MLIYRTEQDLAAEEAEEAGEPTEPVNFAGGFNGVRLLFDLQWWEARLSDIVSHIHPIPPLTVRHRVKLGTQLRQSADALGTHKRISADLPQVLKQQPPASTLIAWVRAVTDHAIRRQQEADDESQKRLIGDYSPTFYEAVQNWIDVKFYKGRKPPRFLPKYMLMMRLDEAYSHNDDWKVSTPEQ